MVGRLLKSMYGTQDASHIWQLDYATLFCDPTQNGTFVRGKHNAALFYSAQMDARMVVHGDDFLCLADDDGLQHVDDKLRSRYTVKDLGTLGPDEKDVRKLNVLNRTFVFGTDVRG